MPHTVTQVLGVGSYGDRRQRGEGGERSDKEGQHLGGVVIAFGVNLTCGVSECDRFNPKKMRKDDQLTCVEVQS